MGTKNFCLLAIAFLSLAEFARCDREHKVHNIVLYPERHSWCQTTPIKQVVAMPGYEPATIDNNVCVGACYSYSIPRTQPAEPGELIGPYCDSCQPLDTKCYHVTLQADKNNADGPRTIQKRVQIITNCSCMSCDKIENKDCEILDQNTSELPTDLFAHLNLSVNSQNNMNDIPELLHMTPPQNRTTMNMDNWNYSNTPTFELNAKLIQLLKTIQNEDDESSNISYDREQLKELLEIIEGSEHELSDKNLMDFVNFVNVHNSEDLELDLSRLKEVLVAFRKDQELMEKHRNFGLGSLKPLDDPLKIDMLERGGANNAEINRDLENLSQKYNIPKTYGLEGSHHGLGHYKGNHIGMGIHHHNDLIKDKTKSEPISGKGHHHLGDEQRIGSEVGHLERGPHGSLTFVPELKLNLDSHMIKPNHEGVVISYENEPKN